jgi:hypothetical protein
MTPDLRQGLKQSLDKIEKLLLSLVIAEDAELRCLDIAGEFRPRRAGCNAQ